MTKFKSLIDAYGESHQNKTNKLIHWICVPAIFFSLVGLISIIPFPWEISMFGSLKLNWAFIALVLVLFYYTSLSIGISIGMTIFAFCCIYLLCEYAYFRVRPLIPLPCVQPQFLNGKLNAAKRALASSLLVALVVIQMSIPRNESILS